MTTRWDPATDKAKPEPPGPPGWRYVACATALTLLLLFVLWWLAQPVGAGGQEPTLPVVVAAPPPCVTTGSWTTDKDARVLYTVVCPKGVAP